MGFSLRFCKLDFPECIFWDGILTAISQKNIPRKYFQNEPQSMMPEEENLFFFLLHSSKVTLTESFLEDISMIISDEKITSQNQVGIITVLPN